MRARFCQALILVFGLPGAAVLALPPALPGPGFPVFAVGLGVEHGEVRELVYKAPGVLLSRLDWPVAWVPQAFLRLGLPLGEDFIFSAGAAFSLPGNSGLMRDFDWVDNSGEITHYSQHDNRMDLSYRAEVLFGYRIFEGGRLSLVWLLGFSLRHLAWTAWDGYAEYPPGSTPQTFEGRVITYDLTMLMLEIGIAAEWALGRDLALLWQARVAPGTMIGWAHDEHLLRDLEFFDRPTAGMAFTVGLGTRIGLGAALFLELGVAYARLLDTSGPSRQLDLASGITSDLGDSGGAAFDQFSFYLMMEWAFP